MRDIIKKAFCVKNSERNRDGEEGLSIEYQ